MLDAPANTRSGQPMCEQCTEIEERIAHYTLFLSRINDEAALAALAALIEELTSKKAALHPEPEE